MKTDCQLEEFFITRLHIDHRQQTAPEKQPAHHLGYGFDYVIGKHKEDECRYRMSFQFTAEEFSENEQPVGLKLDAEIVGFFSINPDLEKKKREALAQLNGASLLYGILRGVVATATGVFPEKKLNLPTVSPQEIVKLVHEKRSQMPAKKREKTRKSQ
jgi:hypothetical protein